MAEPYGQFQYEIYLQGLAGETPDFPYELHELERRFEAEVDPIPRDYVSAGAGREDTMRTNLDAFQRWQIVPRMLANVEKGDLSTTVLGTKLPAPLLLAPIGGIQSLLHPEGELAVARVCKELGIPMVLSTVSSHTLEDVAATLGDTPRWFQLYWPSDDAFTKSLVTRASDAGYSAIVARSTRVCWRGARATSATPISRSSRASRSPTTCRIRCSGPVSTSLPRRTCRPRSSAGCRCSPTRRRRGTASPSCATRPTSRSW